MAFPHFSPEMKLDVVIPGIPHLVTYNWQLIINFFKAKDLHNGG